MSEDFTNRWRHRDKLVFRVWPQFKEERPAALAKNRETIRLKRIARGLPPVAR